MYDIKCLLDKIRKTLPDGDVANIGTMVSKASVEEELEEIRQKERQFGAKVELIKEMDRFRRPTSIIKEFAMPAIRQTIYEMYFGSTSADRLRAAESVLNRAIGKPLDRQVNLNIEVEGYQDAELDSKLESILDELGYKKRKQDIVEVESGPGRTEDEGGALPSSS